MITIVAYGLGNVRAFANTYARHGIPARIATTAEELRSATHLILPGVGAFDWAMQKLAASGLRDALDEIVVEERSHVLGVCVGMQMMVERSEEGVRPGLGWIPGECKRFNSQANGRALPAPHMGWNDIAPTNDPLFKGLETNPVFYFLHSFHVIPRETGAAIACAHYGEPFVCAIRRGNVVGVQFHPEKSHYWGERLLLNFASW